MIDFETFISAYQAASPETKAYIDSEEVGAFCESLLIDSGFEAQKKNLILVISSYFLSILPEENLIDELASTGLSNDFIITKLGLIKEFLSKGISSSEILSEEISDAEAAINSLNSSPHAAETENTYTSTQAAILQEGTRNPNQTTAPGRWETDR